MKKLLAVAMVSIVAYSGWQLRGKTSHREATVVDRLWLDRLPHTERDTINIFLALTEEPIGGFHALSMWKGSFENFRYELSGDELRVVYPQTGERDRVRVKLAACDRDGFDYCLELKGASRGGL